MGKGLLWGLIGGGAALVAIIVIVVLVATSMLNKTAGEGGAGAETPVDAVKGYLTALSKNDSKAALVYLSSSSTRTNELLTDAVLKASNAIAPIGNITTKQVKSGPYSADIDTTFSLGSETVSVTYQVNKRDDTWELYNGVQTLYLSGLQGVDSSINGVSTSKLKSVDVFPGTYQFAVASKYLAIQGGSKLRIVTRNDRDALIQMKVGLNDAGTTKFRSLVGSAVKACVAMKTLSTPCGLDVGDIKSNGVSVVDGSVERSITTEGNATLASLKPEVSYSTPSVVSTYDIIGVDTKVKGTDGNSYTTYGVDLKKPSVDFSAATPKVTWDK